MVAELEHLHMNKARVLIFTGDGKGKTTAAMGLALRASGHGMKVRIIQFIKGDSTTGEYQAAAKMLPNIEWTQCGLGFVPKPDRPDFAKHAEAARKGLELARKAVADPAWKVVILDEICYAVSFGLVGQKDVLDVISSARPDCCLVLTGRGATKEMIDMADTVTEMKCVKHAFSQGVTAQKGVES